MHDTQRLQDNKEYTNTNLDFSAFLQIFAS
jgi:hypothetical protein